jgi:hypothetical protein
MGMSQNKQMMLSTEEITVGPLFANELYNQGKVSERKFSFAMYGYQEDEVAKCDFGQPAAFRTQAGTIN